MNNQQVHQKLFKNVTVERLRKELLDGKSLESYYDTSCEPDESDFWDSQISVPNGACYPILGLKEGYSGDCNDAIAFFEYFALLNETLASDSRLWTYLSHVEFRGYAFERWARPKNINEIYDHPDIREKAIKGFLSHWFVTDNSRSLRRHALARLWWAAKLTHSPWEIDPDFSEDFDRTDPYVLTRALFLTQDVYQALLERNLGRSPRVLLTTLEFLTKHPELSRKGSINHLTSGLNLEYGIRNLSGLNRFELLELLDQIASESNSEQSDLSDIEEF